MKRILAIVLTLTMLLAALTGCVSPQKPSGSEGEQNPSGKRLPIVMTIAETLPSCVAFEYKDEKPYCFYAYDTEGKLYRVFWNDFTGLSEKDVIVVDHNDDIKTLTYDEYPSGWTPQYEVTAICIKPNEMASCVSDEDGMYYLILPQSKDKIKIRDEQRLFVPYISDSLVESAEKKIANDISKYNNNSGYYLQVTEDYLCLAVEVIKQLDPSASQDTGDEVVGGGCGIDHEHLFFSERITLCPVYIESKDHPENQEERKFLSHLSQYLGDINFVPGVSQSEFITMVEGYAYNGTAVTDIIAGVNYDGPKGGGWQVSDDLFGFYNDYTVTEDEKHANYSNRLRTKVPLNGLPLPYDVEFGDTLAEVFEIFGIELDPHSDFSPDKNSDTNMTLYSNGTAALVFQNLKLTKEPVDYELPFVLFYTEAHEIQQDGGKPIVADRVIRLSFDDSENTNLVLVEVSVNELRMLD